MRNWVKENPSIDYLVISDDSGISLPILDGAPGIYSARYAGVGVTDKDNLYKLIDAVKEKGVKIYTCLLHCCHCHCLQIWRVCRAWLDAW